MRQIITLRRNRSTGKVNDKLELFFGAEEILAKTKLVRAGHSRVGWWGEMRPADWSDTPPLRGQSELSLVGPRSSHESRA